MSDTIYRVIVPYYRGKHLREVSYPASGHPLYTRAEAIEVLRTFHKRRQTQPYDPLDCYAEGPHTNGLCLRISPYWRVCPSDPIDNAVLVVGPPDPCAPDHALYSVAGGKCAE